MRRIMPPPPNLREVFAQWGWRRMEALYKARTDTHRKWLHLVGFDAEQIETSLKQHRKELRAKKKEK